VWAGSLIIRVGENRDTLVAIGADSAASLEHLRTLFAAWLDDAMADELATRAPAFRVHLTPPTAGHRGVQAVPHLRHGSIVLTRSRRPDDVLHGLAQVLGGIHRAAAKQRAHVWLRPFVRGDRVVLVDAVQPHLVDDRVLAAAGIIEVATWGPAITDDGSVTVARPLDGLAWQAIGVEPLKPLDALQLEGVVTLTSGATTPAALVRALAAFSTHASWFSALSDLANEGLVVGAADRTDLRQHVQRLLTP
jgi:hypothetical protein